MPGTHDPERGPAERLRTGVLPLRDAFEGGAETSNPAIHHPAPRSVRPDIDDGQPSGRSQLGEGKQNGLPAASITMPRPMVVGLSPHKPAAAPSTSNSGGAPALMDTLTDLEPRVMIDHKTYWKGKPGQP